MENGIDSVPQLSSSQRRIRWVLVFLAITFLLVFAFRAILTPFLVAIFLAYLIDPVVEVLEPLSIRKIRLGRGGSIILIYLCIISVMTLTVWFGGPAISDQLHDIRAKLPQARATIQNWAGVIDEEIDDFIQKQTGESNDEASPPPAPGDDSDGEAAGGDGDPDKTVADETSVYIPGGPLPYRFEFKGGGATEGLVLDRTDDQVVVKRGDGYSVLERARIDKEIPLAPSGHRTRVQDYIERVFKDLARHVNTFLAFAWDFARLVVGTLYGMVLVLMITAFLVIDRDSIVAFIQSLAPACDRELYQKLTYYLDRGLAGVIRGQLAICAVNGLLTWVGLAWMDVPYALLLGVIAGIFSLIPIFGTILSTVPIVMISLGTSGPKLAMLSLGWIMLIHFAEANFLNPKIMGTASKIHPVVVVFALIAGEHTYGLVGALLAVPAASLIQSAFKFYVIDRVPEQFEKERADGLADGDASSTPAT